MDGQTLDLSSGLVPKDQSQSQAAPLDLSAGLTSKSQGPAQTSATAIPENYGFTAGNMAGQAWRGTKELVGGLYEMGKDVLFPEGATESEKLKYLAHKYIIDPAREQEEKAQTAATPAESIGHSVASAIPLIGPWAANLGEQAG